MLRRSLTIGALLLAGIVAGAGLAVAASGQVALPLAHRLQSILVDLHRPAFLIGTKKVSSGFVVAADGLIVASPAGLEQAGLGSEVKLEWTDRRSAEGWLVWKDEEVGYVIVRLLEPMPLFPTVGWRRDGGLRPGEALFGPGPVTGGQPTVTRAVVADVVELKLPSGRRLQRVLVVTPTLGAGLLRSPLLDEAGNLAAMVSTLAPPPGTAPGAVVAVPLSTIWPDLVAARRMRPPRPSVSPPAVARPSYSIGIGIGSGGVRPRIGIGLGGVGVGGLSTRRGRRGPRDDPYMRREQERQDQVQTEALEQALERQMGSGPKASPPLAQTATGPKQTSSPPGEWRAGAASVTSTRGGSSGQVREVRPENLQLRSPSIGSAWNPAGPPLASSPSGKPTKSWPVVVEPKVPTSLRQQQQESDRTKTEALEVELARRGVKGAPAGAPQGEITVLAPKPSSQRRRSLEEMEAELAAVQARTEALRQELEALQQHSSERQ